MKIVIQEMSFNKNDIPQILGALERIIFHLKEEDIDSSVQQTMDFFLMQISHILSI